MSKQIIPEVAILRPLALFLVMLGHCIALFAGFWDKIPSEGGAKYISILVVGSIYCKVSC